MSVSKYRKPEIKTDFSSLPSWLYFILVIILYVFGAYAFTDFILDPANASYLDSLSSGFSVLVPLTLPFLPLLIAFIVIFLFITIILAFVIVWIMSKVAQEVTIVVSILFPIFLIAVGVL
ncbi:MAG: hypothetical protein ACFE9L_07735, partial [Candidatus Hodarchaeota archaeon]